MDIFLDLMANPNLEPLRKKYPSISADISEAVRVQTEASEQLAQIYRILAKEGKLVVLSLCVAFRDFSFLDDSDKYDEDIKESIKAVLKNICDFRRAYISRNIDVESCEYHEDWFKDFMKREHIRDFYTVIVETAEPMEGEINGEHLAEQFKDELDKRGVSWENIYHLEKVGNFMLIPPNYLVNQINDSVDTEFLEYLTKTNHPKARHLLPLHYGLTEVKVVSPYSH